MGHVAERTQAFDPAVRLSGDRFIEWCDDMPERYWRVFGHVLAPIMRVVEAWPLYAYADDDEGTTLWTVGVRPYAVGFGPTFRSALRACVRDATRFARKR